jgi:hypothetical protein
VRDPIREPSLTPVSPPSSNGTTLAIGWSRSVTISGWRVARTPLLQIPKFGNRSRPRRRARPRRIGVLCRQRPPFVLQLFCSVSPIVKHSESRGRGRRRGRGRLPQLRSLGLISSMHLRFCFSTILAPFIQLQSSYCGAIDMSGHW